jgi:hypothetical protein
MPLKAYCSFIALLFLTFNLFSQVEKWGANPPETDLKMTSYPEDTSAKAVILQDIGYIEFDYHPSTGISVLFKQHRRIKVFDQSAFKEGNILIPYNTSGSKDLLNLDVVIFSPSGEKTVVKTANIYTEKLNKYWSAKKIFIPNLQKGSIIEYRFELKTNSFFRLTPWSFQDDLPVRWSELNAEIPEFYSYVTLSNIQKAFEINESISKREKFNYGGESYNVLYIRKALKNMPSIKSEPYLTTVDDYKSHIQFQLKSYTYPGSPTVNLYENWEKLAKELNKHEAFGDQFLKSSKYKALLEEAKPIISNVSLSEDEKLVQLLEYVSKNVKWDNETWAFTDNGINNAFKKHQGNMADINLGLLALCKEAGFDAYPLLISTRDHGYMTPEYPIVDQFNGVLVYIEQKDKTFKILDATNPYLGVNLSNIENYNRGGWIVREKSPDWIEFNAPEKLQVFTANLQLEENGNISGQVKISLNGHAALEMREKLGNGKDLESLKSDFSGRFEEFSIDSLDFENKMDFTKPLVIKYKISLTNAAKVANDFLYCPAMIMSFFQENPFKALTRTCPINFESPLKIQYVVTLKSPKGYKTEEMPSPTNMLLPDNGGKLTFSCGPTPAGDTQIVMRMNVKQLDFSIEEYAGLQQFFSKIIEKSEDQIVFKKL